MSGTVLTTDKKAQNVLGIPISLLNMPGVLDWIEARIAARSPSLLVTADATALVIAHDNPEFEAMLKGADLITADGAGVVWALKREGIENPPKVSGVDIARELLKLSAQKGYRIFFLGGAPGVAELAAERMRLQIPGCNIVGHRHGFFSADDDVLVAEEIAKTKPDVLLVAMGMPRQEQFIRKTQSLINAPIGMGVGGTLDVFSGKAKRAPKVIQAMKLEWLWRLLQNPTKINKVKQLPRFVQLVRKSK